MIDTQATDTNAEQMLWNNVVEKYRDYVQARMELFRHTSSIIDILRKALKNINHRIVALEIAEILDQEKKKQLLIDLLPIACYPKGDSYLAWNIILSLPKNWLIENIEVASEPLLQNGSSTDYIGLLGLCRSIDGNLARKIADRAMQHPDEAIRQEIKDFMTGFGEGIE
jgi:hypothetical protein